MFENMVRYNRRHNISIGDEHTVAIRANGDVIATGDNSYGQCNISNWHGIISVSAGNNHTVGLRSDGTVVATGDNSHGQCNVNGWYGIVAVEASIDFTVGLRADGTVLATGNSSRGQYRGVSEWTDIDAISAGAAHTVGIKYGRVEAVGENEFGQCNTYVWRDIVAISAGSLFTAGLTLNGKVVAVGHNGWGELDHIEEWFDIVEISAGQSCIAALRADGRVFISSDYADGKSDAEQWRGIKDIAIGSGSEGKTLIVGIRSDGSTVVAGDHQAINAPCMVGLKTDKGYPKAEWLADGKWVGDDPDEDDWNGSGKIIWADGSEWKGTFVQGGPSDGSGVIRYSNGNVFTGSFKKFEAVGEGKMVYANGDIYEGNFSESLRDGKGTLKYINGDVFEGAFSEDKCKQGKYVWHQGGEWSGDFNNDQPWSGEGIIYHKSGHIYEGAIKNGKRCGEGKLTFGSGEIFEGSFSDDKMQKGKIKWKKGGEWIGSFYNNYPYDGEGVIHRESGDTYKGTLKNGKYHGEGKLTLNTGSIFIGSFADDKMQKGKITWNKGGEWEGEFNNDQPWKGQGVVYNSYDEVYEGVLDKGKYNGEGKLTLSSGNVYEGHFVNGKQEGVGKFVWQDGGEWIGEFKADKMWKGSGVVRYSHGKIYDGCIDCGEYNGQGKLIKSNGTEYEGEFRKNKLWNGTKLNKNGKSYSIVDGKNPDSHSKQTVLFIIAIVVVILIVTGIIVSVNTQKSKLTDIVGDSFNGTPDATVYASRVDITSSQYNELINDIKYCDDMYSFITCEYNTDFYYDSIVLDIIYENELEYCKVNKEIATNSEEMFLSARECFSKKFISDGKLNEIMFESEHPSFVMIDGQLANLRVQPRFTRSLLLDYNNAGVVSYSATHATVWVAERDAVDGYYLDTNIFNMVRNSETDMWKIDSIKNLRNK